MVDKINTNINIDVPFNYSNNSFSPYGVKNKVETIDLVTGLNASNVSVSESLENYHWNDKINLIKKIGDSENDDLLNQKTIGFNGEYLNYTKRIKDSNGNISYFNNGVLIKVIQEDGSVSFRNQGLENIDDCKDVNELTYYPCSDDSVMYSYLYKNGVSRLIHSYSNGYSNESVGIIDDVVKSNYGTYIPKIKEINGIKNELGYIYIEDYCINYYDFELDLLKSVKPDGSTYEYKFDNLIHEDVISHAVLSNGLVYDGKLIYKKDNIAMDLSKILEDNLIDLSMLYTVETIMNEEYLVLKFDDYYDVSISIKIPLNMNSNELKYIVEKDRTKLNKYNLYDVIIGDIENKTLIVNDEMKMEFKNKIIYEKHNETEEWINNNFDKIIRYYCYIDSIFEDSISFSEKLEYCKLLESKDEKNYNKILYSTPVLENGFLYYPYEYSGNYLKYYNQDGLNCVVPFAKIDLDYDNNVSFKKIDDRQKQDVINLCGNYYSCVIKSSEVYSDKFKNVINESLKNVAMCYYENDCGNYSNGAAITYGYIDCSSDITVKINWVKAGFNTMLDSYTHELGHVYSNALNNFDKTNEWKNIYNQINEKDSEHSLLRDYAHSSAGECFAECVAEYFNSSGDNTIYNPNDLKAIDIDVDGYDTLYDYMDSILN